ncbi:unnamed protein product [Caenorhabditis auriculariae]|uniref:aECM cysteine-cradle domain-containing protein n=1 Tax=Caenorhabditis auriculariae TaxID=2777116 RepID=A0A8S1GQ95_9PELO|nr:unnamed protein product [Caenorhabditis auriculariae]
MFLRICFLLLISTVHAKKMILTNQISMKFDGKNMKSTPASWESTAASSEEVSYEQTDSRPSTNQKPTSRDYWAASKPKQVGIEVTPASTPAEEDFLSKFPKTAWSHSAEDDENDDISTTVAPSSEITEKKLKRISLKGFGDKIAQLDEIERRQQIARAKSRSQKKKRTHRKYQLGDKENQVPKTSSAEHKVEMVKSEEPSRLNKYTSSSTTTTTTTEEPKTTPKKKLRRKLKKRVIDRKRKQHSFEQESYLGGWKEEGIVVQPIVRDRSSSKEETPAQPKTVKKEGLREEGEVVRPELTNVETSIDQKTLMVPVEQSVNDTYLKAYYEAYYKEWYRLNNKAQLEQQTAQPKKITIGLKNKSSEVRTPATTGTSTAPAIPPQQAQVAAGPPPNAPPNGLPGNPFAFLDPVQTGAVSPSKQQLDTICHSIRAVSKSFGIRDPISFAKNNCGFVKLYYPNVTCLQIQHTMEYCAPILSS